MTRTIVRHCPLCEWTYVMPDIDARINENALAGVFGHGIMINAAINRRNEEVEVALAAHLNTHTVVEWLKKVTALQSQVEKLQAIFQASCP